MDFECNAPNGIKCGSVTTTPSTIEDIIGEPIPPGTTNIRIIFEGAWRLKEIARYTRDPITPTLLSATVGNPIYPFAFICLGIFEFDSLFVTITGEAEVCIEFYTAVEVCDFQDEYRQALIQLLPNGFAWEAKCIRESVLYRLLNSFAKLFSDFHCRLLELECDYFASLCKELCDNWCNEAFTSIVKTCLDRNGLSGNQFIVATVAKYVAGGAYRVSDFQKIAEAFGLDVTIVDDPLNFTMTFTFNNVDLTLTLACDIPLVNLLDQNVSY